MIALTLNLSSVHKPAQKRNIHECQHNTFQLNMFSFQIIYVSTFIQTHLLQRNNLTLVFDNTLHTFYFWNDYYSRMNSSLIYFKYFSIENAWMLSLHMHIVDCTCKNARKSTTVQFTIKEMIFINCSFQKKSPKRLEDGDKNATYESFHSFLRNIYVYGKIKCVNVSFMK